ncbi:hypothetical protein ABQX22_15685 [Xanthomonas sp. WHRI 1810A]|uniref:hypothetical protein n=1 Tax=Xanthomonas sp. WHRI 1810A TaxID=3161565 RepID=UPI0032E8DD73
MNPSIIIEANSKELYRAPRELLCSIWPVSMDGSELRIGDPVFSNHMVLIGASRNDEAASILTLPAEGSYLIDIGYPNGRSQRATISVKSNQTYRLVLNAQKRREVPATPKKEHDLSWLPKVISAAAKRSPKKKNDLEVSILTQSEKIPLNGLYDFFNDTAKRTQDDNHIFVQTIFDELGHEIPLTFPSWEYSTPSDFDPKRKWLMIRSKGRSQTLIAYPQGWRNGSDASFNLLIGYKNKERHDTSRWTASLKLMDPIYGSMVEHLTRRDICSSRLISESERGRAVTALYRKADNPFSAAAAAYIFALDGNGESTHKAWMSNLNDRHDWLPDSAIALGWKTLYDGDNDVLAWQKARELFSLACSRGLPYYTIGLHILVDALTLLSQVTPNDHEILGMLAAAKAADVACVRTEPFTTLQIPKYLGLPVKRS